MSQAHKALLFALILIGVVMTSCVVAYTNSGPVVLGTELNTNGLTEYLCLSRDCEDLF